MDESRERTSLRNFLLVLGILLAAWAGLWYFHFRYDQSMRVTATAFNSVPEQTDRQPNTAAWGNRLKPGDKAIAVSRDLIDRGLKNGTPVRIEGLFGTYTVRDKMNKRYRRRIDIYMGADRQRAMKWGKQKVRIRWPGDDR
ncbi:MAG: hypothetical protein GF333_05870 [Candidatus Omnitrophica bacterium]|nr:hypothetical protein [Candidatus Omnitrophota bacterium]